MQLAQLNIAKAKYDMEAPEIKDFVDNLEPVNGIAEQSPGFIWRLQDESGDATNIRVLDDPDMLVNMSVWASVDDLKNFIFRTVHINFLKRKKEWFHLDGNDTYVLWWIEDGHIPTLEEAMARLNYLRENGDTPYAFSFKSNFSAEESLTFNVNQANQA